MKKLKSFTAFITLASILLLPLAPVFALGEVDLGTTGSAPMVTTETAPPTAPTVTQTTPTISTSPAEPATTTTTPGSTSTNTTTTVGDTTVSTNTSTSTTPSTSVTISDTTPPVISDIVSASVLPTEATVAWVTNELSVSHFRYGTTTNYGSTVTLGVSGTLIHAATMLNLTLGTTYYYCIDATDLANNATESCGHQFTTAAQALQADTNPPTISSVTIAPITINSATVSWTTDELANGQIEYGTTQDYGSTTIENTDYTLLDSATLSNLLPNTEYHYHITSRDEIGNTVSAPDETFMTEMLPSTGVTVTAPTEILHTEGTGVPPAKVSLLISGIETSFLGETSATVSWMTDVPSDSQVEYGNSINLGFETSVNSTLNTNHSVTISNLTPDTNYIFRIKSKPLGTSIATVSNLHEFSTLITPIFVTTPANITSVASSEITTTGANIAWTTDIATTGHIEYGITTEYGQVASSPANQSSHTASLPDLAPDTTYHFRVKALNTAGDITYSDDQTFMTPAATSTISTVNIPTNSIAPIVAPASVANLSVTGHDETSALLSWNAASVDSDAGMLNDVRYNTTPVTESNWNSTTSAQVTPIAYPDLSPNGTARTYFVAGLAPNTTYYFAIKSKYEASGWSAISNIVSVTTLAMLPTDTSSNTQNNEAQNTNSGNGNLVAGEPTANINIGNSTNTITGGLFAPETTTSLPIQHPTFINGTGLDRQIIFTWNNPNEADFVRTIIVRKAGSYPTSPTDGSVIHESNSETFTDTDVTNGTRYYYAFYSYDHARNYSESVRVSLAPTAPIVYATFSRGGSGGSSGGTVSPQQFVLHETPVIMPREAAEHFTTVWEKGDQNIEVEHVQHVLKVDGEFYPGERIDGQFGPITEKGLKQFQAKYNLPQSGITDQPTQKQLNLSSQSLVALDAPEDATVLETDLKPGNKNDTVKGLQQLLSDEGSYAGPVDGQFGQQTKSAVRAFQVKYFVKPPDGIVGPKTRHMLKILTGM